MLLGSRKVIPIIPGVSPDEDSTPLDSMLFNDSNRIRFQNGKLRQIGGWQRIFSGNWQTITGAARTIYSYVDGASNPITIIGTNTRLYASINDTFYNITPLSTDTDTIADAFTTEFNHLVSVNMTTVSGSSVVTLAITQWLNPNDQIQISDVSGGPYNGITAGGLNQTFSAQVNSGSSISINTGVVANASGTVAVTMTWATSYLYVAVANHGLVKGDRIGILDADTVGNILDTSINIENWVTNVVSSGVFTIQTDTIATSKVTAGGGSDTTIQYQIDAGNADQSSGFGYGGGKYGVGLYGTAKKFTGFNSLDGFPRIWSMDTFGGLLVLTPGDPPDASTDNLYLWSNDIAVAPVLLSGVGGAADVPLSVRWVYVSNSIIVTLAAGNVLNQFYAANAGTYSFTIDATSTAFVTTIEQAGQLISQASCRGFDLLFTQNDVYKAQYVGPPFYWIITRLFTTDGIMGPKARVEIEDFVVWMGKGDLYISDGTTVNVLPNNSVKRFIYDHIDFSQGWKCFAYPNVAFQEVSWFYVQNSGQEPIGNNPVTYVTYNYKEKHWVLGAMPRSAAEEPINAEETPLMIQTNGTGADYLFQHESGLNDYNTAYNPDTDPYEAQFAPLNAFATTTYAMIDEVGNNTMMLYSLYTDSIQAQDLSITVNGKLYAQGPSIVANGGAPYIVTPNTTKIDIMLVARQRQYVIATTTVNSNFLIGHWIEEVKESSAR